MDYVEINPRDRDGLIAVMDDCKANPKKYEQYLIGKNESGEKILLYVNEDNIVVETWQSNGWIRKNYYYRDPDCPDEELFDGRW